MDPVHVRPLRAVKLFDPTLPHPWLGAGVGLTILAVLVPLLEAWHGTQGVLGQSMALLFLIPVLLSAALAGRGVGVGVALAATAAWDWFFIPPHYRITIASVNDASALVIFLAVALLTGQLATVARARTREALRRSLSSQALYELSAALIGRSHVPEVLASLAAGLRETFHLDACAVLLAPTGHSISETAALAGALPPALRVEQSRDAAAVATWVHREGTRAGMRSTGREPGDPSGRWPELHADFWPLRARGQAIGVLELVHRQPAFLDPDQEQLLETLVNGVAIALEQGRLAREEEDAHLAREADRLKSALLSSLSHDLRTPLATIKAAASSLLQDDVLWSDADRQAFLRDIDAEADRLTRLVANLLDLSRIEAGAIVPNREWEDVDELIARVVARLEPQVAGHPIVRAGPAQLPWVRIDALQIEQVLTNLIENAAKYSPAGMPIEVAAEVAHTAPDEHELRLSVSDQGAGIRPEEQRRIFDRFYRSLDTSSTSGGTGMGLAIVKGLVESHGGWVRVRSAPGAGSTFTVVIPVETAGQADVELQPPVAEPHR